MSGRDKDEIVPEDVIADLWGPDRETWPAWARKCRRCHLIYTSGLHYIECPSLRGYRPLSDAEWARMWGN